MPVVAVFATLATLVWATVYARRGSLLSGCTIVLIIGYVLGHWFWHADVGPLPLTLDRIALVGLAGAFVAQWRWGRLDPKPVIGADWLVFALLAVLTLSTIVGYRSQLAPDVTSPVWRLIASFWIPVVLYWMVREARIELATWKELLAGLACLGVYLAVTAVAEVAGQWWAVFPRYIADPQLGMHFGRARGPMLNSASLGVYLTICLWCACTLWNYVGRGWKLLLVPAISLMAVAVYFTYTRSTWLGLAASTFVVLWICLPRRWRLPVMGGGALAGLAVLAISWGQIVGLEREGSAGDSQHSVQQRAAFAYVSWQMFQDHPILGVGFGRFYDQKLPYLADRSQDFELESIRPLHHHNTFLSLLTETGMVGLAAFLAVLVAWIRHAWRLSHANDWPDWARAQGVLMLAALAAYLPTAVFHDVTLSPSEQWLMFVLAGLTIGLAGKRPCQPPHPATQDVAIRAMLNGTRANTNGH